MTAYWQRLGFPFDRLVPSYATAIGSSSDRPAALARLMGIILNDGLQRPRAHLRRLVFAAGTPYRTDLERAPVAGERRMPVPVARALRAVLADTVERGTARRLRGALRTPDGEPVTVGAKTGSGDNRRKVFARGGRLLASRAVSRTSAVVFSIGDRYYGVMTASVAGPTAERYRFTSALPLAVLRLLAPELNTRLDAPPSA